ncbi:LIP2M Octanoyltransferase, partial [Psilopogon haemacephalus]|nr:LIP2M Octanoyltransferase [Psilopogon haemacephalus]
PPPFTGVWVEERKICSIGVQCSQHITSHGLAVNCCPELSWFGLVNACGQSSEVTSLSRELQQPLGVQQALGPFLQAFQEHFPCSLHCPQQHQ